ncbi:hypothetical protein F3Y22_tig00111769pilonHSYRG00339 [Hibiscus syriacus]|uniref:Uncharacterized protein n=1 Tax=Hibiscus syriacus TaxID=106335 RepID=A0A6A2YHD6_HIBSY|nr:hypothetical protein F3Y22_tig00111769pilonHSYRG00339 [Hibiscus syriacus]
MSLLLLKYINSYRYSPLAYVLCLVFLILFTISAIAGCGVMFLGEKRFLGALREAAGYVVHQGETISNGLIIVVNYLQLARNVSLNNKFLPPEIINQIDKVTSTLDESKDLPHLTMIRMADSLFEILKHEHSSDLYHYYHASSSISWILIFGCWLANMGLYIRDHRVGLSRLSRLSCAVLFLLSTNTCTMVDEWVQNPMAGSAIKELLPCVDREFGKNIKDVSKSVSNGINDLLNLDVSLVANNNDIPPHAVGLYYNQSGPSLPTVCDPYKAENNKQACGEGQVAVGNATQKWSKFVCHVSSSGICSAQWRLTPDLYKQMSSAANISYVLSRYVPFLASLVDCSTIWEILNYMHQHYCLGLRKHSQEVYIGLLVTTISVMFCLVSWFVIRNTSKFEASRWNNKVAGSIGSARKTKKMGAGCVHPKKGYSKFNVEAVKVTLDDQARRVTISCSMKHDKTVEFMGLMYYLIVY